MTRYKSASASSVLYNILHVGNMNTVSIPMLFSKQTAGELSVVMLLLAVHMYRPTTLQNTSKVAVQAEICQRRKSREMENCLKQKGMGNLDV